MTLDEKLKQLTLLSDGQMKDDPSQARQGRRRRVQRDRPGADRQVPARRGRELAPAHPDPVRVRHDPRVPDDLPDPARRRRRASIPTVAYTDHKIGAFESAAVGIKQIYSPMVDVSHEPRWGRISEAAGEDPYLNSVMAAARVTGAQGTRLLARPTRSSRASSTSSPTASRRAGATTTRPTCPSSGCGTSTCRRSRPRSTPARTRSCARSTRSTASPGCANAYTETDILKERVGLRRLHRERLHRRRRAARLPGREARQAARAATASPPTAVRPPRTR